MKTISLKDVQCSEGGATIYADKATILEKYESEKRSMGKAALITLLINVVIASFFYLFTTLPIFSSNESVAILQTLALIILVFTGLTFLGYIYRVRKWRRSSL